mgnify:CR=1 FL=1
MNAFEEVVAKFGGQSAMARHFKLTPWAVSKWKDRVPAERCPEIEKQTGVRCERLRPDIDWSVLRESKKEVTHA